MMEYGMKIGHDREAVEAVRSAIDGIVNAPTGDVVKVAALKALTKTLAMSGMTVSNCHITGDEIHHHTHYAEPEPETTDDYPLDEEA